MDRSLYVGGERSEVFVEQHILFHVQLKREREHAGWSQAELAEKLGNGQKTVQRWESGEYFPQPLYRRRLCELFGKTPEELGLLNGSQEVGIETVAVPYLREDWGEAPLGRSCYGRVQELARLEQWIVQDQCRVVAMLGIGGIGKTTLAVHVAQQVKGEFEHVFWRSLQNAPPLSSLLQQCIQFVSDQQRIDLPARIDEQISVLISYLQNNRCLLVLDNVESILRPGPRAGHYLEGYEGYGELIKHLGEVPHHSCLILTSREKPGEVARLEGRAAPVRSLPLPGMEQRAGQELLYERKLVGSEEQWSRLVTLYSGNPLALELVSNSIQTFFGGDIGKFLQADEIVFGDINDLLEQQFKRLSPEESELLYWLAIEREPVSWQEIQADLMRVGVKHSVLNTLEALHRRFLIESRDAEHFALQPVILEYVTNELVRRACEEFMGNEAAGIWLNYALIKAQAKEYVRESQVHLILTPIAQYLRAEVGEEGIESKLNSWLELRRQSSPHQRSYIAGNTLNLLNLLQCDLHTADFSHLMIMQAYLQDIALPEVDFSFSHFSSTVFTNIFGNVLSIVCSHAKNLMAVGTATGEIWVYEMLTGVPVLTLSGHTDGVWSVVFSPDEQTLVSSSDDRTIRFWNLSTGECLKVVTEHTHRVRSVAFSPDGRTLASGCDDNVVRLWDIQNGRYTNEMHGHTERVWSVAFSPDGRTLASGSNDYTIRLWNIATDACLGILEGHSGWIWSVAFNAEGTMLASGSEDATVRLWDVKSMRCIETLRGHTSGVRSVAFNAEGTMLASGSEDATVRLWDVTTGHCQRILPGHLQGVRSIAFQPGGPLLASGGDDQTLRLWDVATGYSLKTLQGYTRRIWSVAFSPDGQSLVSSSEDRRIRLWNLATGQLYNVLADRAHGVRSVIFSPDGSLLASAGEDQTVRVWSIAKGRSVHTLKEHKKWVRSVAFSADGHQLLSGGEDAQVCLWDIDTGQVQMIPQGHISWVRSVAFSPDGSLLASGGDDQMIRLWNQNTHQPLAPLSGHTGRVRSIDFSPDGSLLASGSEDQSVRLWNVSAGSTYLTLEGHTSWIRAVVFNPDGSLLASSSDDATIRLWNVADGRCIATLCGHTDRVRSVAFSPDGSLLASGSDDGDIKLWNVQEGTEIKNMVNEKPYEGMNITGTLGLTEAQKEALRLLGALET